MPDPIFAAVIGIVGGVVGLIGLILTLCNNRR
jgi:hypothetical protein